jgi:hypothetical protein
MIKYRGIMVIWNGIIIVINTMMNKTGEPLKGSFANAYPARASRKRELMVTPPANMNELRRNLRKGIWLNRLL